jgi:hypothetical protein
MFSYSDPSLGIIWIDKNGLHEAPSLSFIAFHQGLSQAQSTDLYNAVQALRMALGGGYV